MTMMLYAEGVIIEYLGKQRKIGKKSLDGKAEFDVWKLVEKPEYEIQLSYNPGKDVKERKEEYRILGITKKEMLELCKKFRKLYDEVIEQEK